MSRSGPSRRTPGIDARPFRNRAANRRSWSIDHGPAEILEKIDCGVKGNGADDIWRSRFLAIGRFGPDDLVQVDQVDSPSAGEERITLGEGRSRPDQHTGPERGVHLVAAESYEVGVRMAAGDAARAAPRRRRRPLHARGRRR